MCLLCGTTNDYDGVVAQWNSYLFCRIMFLFFSRNFSQPCWHCHASVLITDSNWNKDEGDQIKTNNLLRIYFAISCFAFTRQCLFFIRLTAITIWFFAIQNSNHETFIESLAGKISLFYYVVISVTFDRLGSGQTTWWLLRI